MERKELVTKLSEISSENNFTVSNGKTVIYGKTEAFGERFLYLVGKSDYRLSYVENRSSGLLYIELTNI